MTSPRSCLPPEAAPNPAITRQLHVLYALHGEKPARFAPERFRLTVQDIERYGPGVAADYARAGKNRVLLWVD